MKNVVLQAATFVAIAVTVSGCYTRVEDHPTPVAAAPSSAPAVVVAPRPSPNTVIVQP